MDISLSAPSRAAVTRRKTPHQTTIFQNIDTARYPQGQTAGTFSRQELPIITKPFARYSNAPSGIAGYQQFHAFTVTQVSNL
jgi:hypothetical protein